MNGRKAAVDRQEALRYLGYRGQPDKVTAEELLRAAQLVEGAAQPRYSLCRARLDRSDAGLLVSGTTLVLPGRDIAALLRDCRECILLCATLGEEPERLIRQWQIRNMGFAAMLDACASSAVENICDQAVAALIPACRAAGEYLTDRFSPGYGDLPIELQKNFCAVLDTMRQVGVCVSGSGILIPRKSVTAILGVAKTPQPHREGCSGCPNSAHCAFRKEGTVCGSI